ncbi:hypothetical protein BH11CYA1_BH11CYA1_08110 [soil metagenome]
MRLFNGTSLGVQIVDNGFLQCGDEKVEFLPSLYTTRGATFGNSLMFGTLVLERDGGYRLQGCPVDSHQIRGMEALILVNLKVAPQGKVTHPADSFGAKVALPQRITRSRPRAIDSHEFHALVVLRPGHEIELTDTYVVSDPSQPLPKPIKARRGSKGAPIAQAHSSPFAQVERVCKTRIAFDGKTVTISSTN